MGVEILKFNNIIMDKKTFHKLKEPIDLLSVDTDEIVVFDKSKHNKGFISLVTGMNLFIHFTSNEQVYKIVWKRE